MINLESIFKINNRNDYKYIFYEYYGHGYFFGYLNGDGNGHGFSNRFGLSDGDGNSYSLDYLIRSYKND